MKLGKKVKFFQEGGVMAPQQDPMQVLLQGAQQALQSQDCEIAMQVCQMLVELTSGAQQAAPAAPAAEEPVYRQGGRLIRRIKA